MNDEPVASSNTDPDPSDSLPTTDEILDALSKVASGQVPDRRPKLPKSQEDHLEPEDEADNS